MADYAYKGNDDFRGWLAAGSGSQYYATMPVPKLMYGGRPEDATSMTNLLLGNLGNDGRSGNSRYDTMGQYLYGKWQGAKEKNNYDKQYQQQLALINAMKTPTPRFINYDVTGSWNKAREMAANAVSPMYKQKMDDKILQWQNELEAKKSQSEQGKSALDLALSRLLEDTGTQRARTAEDTATNVKDINDTQAFQTRQDSLNYDATSRALTEGIGAGNMAQSGLGQQQIQENNLKYRENSNEQIRQMDNKVEAQNTLMNRTFEDLGTKETRAGEDTTSGKSKIDIDLEQFIKDQDVVKQQTKHELAASEAADIAQKSIGLQGQLVDQWIQSLQGKGYTAQEIANAASIYK